MSEDGKSVSRLVSSMMYFFVKVMTIVLERTTDHRKWHPAELAFSSLLNHSAQVGLYPLYSQ